MTTDDMRDGMVSGCCPRRLGEIGPWTREPNQDSWREDDNTCNFCGSLHPDRFMEMVEAGTVELGTTDKSYKVYLHAEGLKQAYRDDGGWHVRETDWGKFYFQHLSAEQQKRFVELLNDRKLKFKGGYGFYVLPFFVQLAPSEASE